MTNPIDEVLAWLEETGGNRRPLRGACYLGRSASNQICLPDDRVSRRHAVIQAQLGDEYWLVDFGSRNGTYLNEKRIVQPTRLQHGDVIRVGPFQLKFGHRNALRGGAPSAPSSDLTVSDIKMETCWLLVADIIDSSRLVKELPPDELPVVTGRWVSECKQTIESQGGWINQFMGDGFFACWRDHERIAVSIHQTIEALQRMQEHSKPAFRFVLHLGKVSIGGVSVGEEERISGTEVHFVFRQEKLAASLDFTRLMSEPAWNRMSALVKAHEAGSHRLAGIDGDYRFFTF